MAKNIKTEVLINASPPKIWAILTNFSDYPNWNPFIKSIEGNVQVGEKVKVYIEPAGQKGMTFKPRILTFVLNKELCWKGHLLFPGIFDGTHKFALIDNKDGSTTLIHSESFRGILPPIMSKTMFDNTRRGFVAMNKKLKELSERK